MFKLNVYVRTTCWVVINPRSIKLERLWLGVDKDTDGTIERDSLLQLACISFRDVHVEVELRSCCGVLEMTEPFLKHRNET